MTDFKKLFESAPGIYLVSTPDFTIVAVSDVFEMATMTKRENIVGRNIFDVFPDNPNDPKANGAQQIKESFHKVLKQRAPDEMPILKYDIPRPESEGGGFEVRYWSPVNIPIFDDNGHIQYVLIKSEDVTDIVRLKEEVVEQQKVAKESESRREKIFNDLQATQTRFERMFEFLPDAIVVISQKAIVQINHQAEKLFGYTRDELIGQPIEILIPERFSKGHVSHRTKFMNNPEIRPMGAGLELYGRRRDGSEFPVDIMLSPFETAEGKQVVAIVRDTTDRKLITKRLQDSQMWFERMFEFSPDAIVVINQKAIVQVNRQVERIFGYSRDELIGQPIEILVPERFLKNHESYRTKFMNSPEVRPMGAGLELYGRRRDGSEFPVDIMLSPFETAEGKQVIGIVRDITERKQSEQEIRSARVAAENASRAKSEFLATMSHELRTPLNAIIGFSEILKAQSFGTLNDKQTDYITDVWESGKYLLSLINDILDLSKVEAGKMGLELGEFNLQTVLPNCLVMVRERAIYRGIEIAVDIDGSISSIVADERKLKQIIYNLLSNAIKFTPEFGRIGLEVKRKDGAEILFSVWDNGIGIEEKDKEKIFQEFTRIDSTYSRKSPGTGLGLVLVKKFVELHGGKIWFESGGKDQGTRFSFILPAMSGRKIQNGSPSLKAADDNKIPAANQDKHRVLLIEDDPKSAKLIVDYIQDLGYVLDVVSSGEEGLEMARSLIPSLIILDIILPNKDGWDVLIELKMDPLTKDIPILVTSVVQAQGKGLTLGAVDYLIKPISKDELVSAIAKVSFSPRGEGKPVKILAIDDEETSLKIIEAILRAQGFQVSTAQDGRKGLELIFQEKPELVLLDLVMPGMTGFDILVQLRADPATKDIPVIVVTAKSLTEEEKNILNSQAQIIIEKSNFDKGALLKEIALVTGRRKQG